MLENLVPEITFLKTSLLGLLVLLTVFWFRGYQKRRNMPPGPYGLPLIGNILQLMNATSFRKFQEWSKTYGPVITVKFGPATVVVLNNIDVVLEALVKRGSDFANRTKAKSVDAFTDGGRDIIFGQYGPTWKLHRKLSSKALRLYMQGERLDSRLHKALENVFTLMDGKTEPYDPMMYLNLTVTNITCGICFGHSYEFDDPEFRRIIELDDKATAEFANSFFLEDFIPGLTRFPTKKFSLLVALVKELTDEIFGKKFKQHKETFDKDNIRDFTDFLILALEEAKEEEDDAVTEQLDDRYLIQTLLDIFFAGLDTSRFTLMYALIHMAAYPDIQSKVQAELDSVLKDGELPSVQHRPQMGYTEAALHESMRLASITPTGVPHKTLRDTKIMNYDIPKDTDIIINHWALHHDPDKWTDVDTFIPERFLDADGKLGPKPESWLPFSAGRRVCLGESVAKPELHLLFATLMHRYTWQAPEGGTIVVKGNETFGVITPLSQKLQITKRFK